jgi:hypothetical protein
MAETRRPTAEETEVAQSQKALLVKTLERKRLLSCVGFLVLLAGAVIAANVGPGLVAFSIAALSLIVLLQAVDAHGHLREVRRRRAVSLFPDFSVFERQAKEPATKAAIHP